MEILIKVEENEELKNEELIPFLESLKKLSIPVKIIFKMNSPGVSNKILNTNANN